MTGDCLDCDARRLWGDHDDDFANCIPMRGDGPLAHMLATPMKIGLPIHPRQRTTRQELIAARYRDWLHARPNGTMPR